MNSVIAHFRKDLQKSTAHTPLSGPPTQRRLRRKLKDALLRMCSATSWIQPSHIFRKTCKKQLGMRSALGRRLSGGSEEITLRSAGRREQDLIIFGCWMVGSLPAWRHSRGVHQLSAQNGRAGQDVPRGLRIQTPLGKDPLHVTWVEIVQRGVQCAAHHPRNARGEH